LQKVYVEHLLASVTIVAVVIVVADDVVVAECDVTATADIAPPAAAIHGVDFGRGVSVAVARAVACRVSRRRWRVTRHCNKFSSCDVIIAWKQ